MSCKKYQSSIIGYVLGELSPGEAAECRNHIDTCANCREIYEGYARLVTTIEREPSLAPTLAESNALCRAIAQAEPAGQVSRAQREPLPQGFPALIWASLVAFVVVASILALQVWGCLNLVNVARTIGPAPIVLAVVVTIFVTSFLPIAVAAKRRPLNGMTFRR